MATRVADRAPLLQAFDDLNDPWLSRAPGTQLASVAADALFIESLAGSLFQCLDRRRPARVLLHLLLTLAPFAVVGPFVGPVVDRLLGGQRVLRSGAGTQGRDRDSEALAWVARRQRAKSVPSGPRLAVAGLS